MSSPGRGASFGSPQWSAVELYDRIHDLEKKLSSERASRREEVASLTRIHQKELTAFQARIAEAGDELHRERHTHGEALGAQLEHLDHLRRQVSSQDEKIGQLERARQAQAQQIGELNQMVGMLQAEIRERDAALGKSQHEVAAAREEMEYHRGQAAEKVSSTSAERDEALRKVHQLQEEMSQLQSSARGLSAETSELQHELQGRRAAADKLLSDRSIAEKHAEEWREKHQALSFELASVQAQAERSRIEAADCREELKRAQQAAAAVQHEGEKRVAGMLDELKGSSRSSEDLRSKVQAISVELQAEKLRCTGLQRRIDQVQLENSEHVKAREHLQTTVRMLEDHSHRGKDDYERMLNKVKAAEGAVSGLEDEKRALQAKINDMEVAVRLAEEDTNRLRRATAELDEMKEAEHSVRATMRDAVARMENQEFGLRAEVASVREQCDRKVAECQMELERLRRCEKDLEATRDSLDRSDAKVAVLEQRAAELQGQCDQWQRRLTVREQENRELEELRAELQQKWTKIDELTAPANLDRERARLEDQLSVMESRLASSESKRRNLKEDLEIANSTIKRLSDQRVNQQSAVGFLLQDAHRMNSYLLNEAIRPPWQSRR